MERVGILIDKCNLSLGIARVNNGSLKDGTELEENTRNEKNQLNTFVKNVREYVNEMISEETYTNVMMNGIFEYINSRQNFIEDGIDISSEDKRVLFSITITPNEMGNGVEAYYKLKEMIGNDEYELISRMLGIFNSYFTSNSAVAIRKFSYIPKINLIELKIAINL